MLKIQDPCVFYPLQNPIHSMLPEFQLLAEIGRGGTEEGRVGDR